MDSLHIVFLRGLMLKSMWELNKPVLSDDLFTSTDIRTLYQYIAELHEERISDLVPSDLRLKIESKYPQESTRREELLDLVALLDGHGPVLAENVQPLLADFAARELARKCATYIARAANDDSWDLEKAYAYLERALYIQTNLDLGVESQMDQPEPNFTGDRPGVVTVGLGPTMDGHLGGGVANGELLIWLGGYGQGKTSFMINQAVELALRGKHVLYVSREISKAKCYQRMDQKLTGYTRDERLANPKAVMAMRRLLAGQFYVKDWSHAKVTVDDIKALVKRMRAKGQRVDTVFVDYMKLLDPIRNNRHGERFNYSQIAMDLRALANELSVPLITAWQVNRTGYEKQVISAVDVQECWDIVTHADIILGINQNDVERDMRMVRVNIIKQREATMRPVEYYKADLDRMVIKETRDAGDTDEEPADYGSDGQPEDSAAR